jgi:hypothetical protein
MPSHVVASIGAKMAVHRRDIEYTTVVPASLVADLGEDPGVEAGELIASPNNPVCFLPGN